MLTQEEKDKLLGIFQTAEDWTVDAYARAGGVRCHPLDPKADCYCLTGAIRKYWPASERKRIAGEIHSGLKELGHGSSFMILTNDDFITNDLAAWNDRQTWTTFLSTIKALPVDDEDDKNVRN